MSELPNSCQRFMDTLERRLVGEGASAEALDEAQRHARECAECGAMAHMLKIMAAPVQLSADEHLTYRQAALDAERGIVWRRRTRWALAAAIVGLALGGLLWRFAAIEPTKDAPASLALASPWCGKQHIVGGERLEPCDHAGVLELSDGTRLRLEAESVAVFATPSADERRVRLERGGMTLQVTPSREGRFVVETSYCEARVLGTIFQVRLVEGDAEVAVVKGLVEVAARSLPQPERLDAGRTLAVKKRRRGKISAQRRAQIVTGLALSELTPDAGPPRAKRDARRPDLARPPARESARPPTLKELLARARRCRAARDLRCARASYLRLQALHGSASVAVTSLVALAEIELELGVPAAALKHVRAYLRRRPKGALELEARYAELRALRKLGRRSAERKATQRFLRRFPSSIHAPALRARLERL